MDNQSINIFLFSLIFNFHKLAINGSDDSIKYLQSNQQNVIFSFLHFVHFGNKQKIRNNCAERVDIDKLMKIFRNNLEKQVFAENELYYDDQDKLENIGYKFSFQFHRNHRFAQNQNEQNGGNYGNVSWREMNAMFIRFLLNNMMNHCDDTKKYQDYYDEIHPSQIKEGDAFHILSGCDLRRDVTVYCMDITTSKHTAFLGASSAFKKSKKVSVSTIKTSYAYFFDDDFRVCSLLKMVNDASSDHIKAKANYGHKFVNYYVESVVSKMV